MNRIPGLVFWIMLSLRSMSQTDPEFIGVNIHGGFIIPHSAELKPVSDTNPIGLQLEYNKLKLDRKAWETCNCYGRTGWSFLYMNYNDPDQLGSSYNLIYYVQPYFDYTPPLTFSLKAGGGITYLDQVYDEETNPENLFYSSPLSFYLFLAPTVGFIVSDKWELALSANYNHISNGGSKQPNKGMNFPSLSIGASRMLNYQLPESRSPSSEDRKKWEKYLGAFGSLRSADESTEGSNYLMTGLNAGIMRPLSVLNGLNAGIEISYDDSYRERLERMEVEESPWIVSAMVGHQFTVGQFYFIQQFGFYLIRPEEVQPKDVFQRYSIYYKLRKGLGFGTSLIAHGHVADHMDLRLIYFW